MRWAQYYVYFLLLFGDLEIPVNLICKGLWAVSGIQGSMEGNDKLSSKWFILVSFSWLSTVKTGNQRQCRMLRYKNDQWCVHGISFLLVSVPIILCRLLSCKVYMCPWNDWSGVLENWRDAWLLWVWLQSQISQSHRHNAQELTYHRWVLLLIFLAPTPVQWLFPSPTST